MRAQLYRNYAAPLEAADLPRPSPAADQVLVRVRRASINPVDWKQASGSIRLIMPVKLPCVPGYDLAGEVVEAGANARAFTPGMRVHTRLAVSGASAEYALCDLTTLSPVPDGMSDDEAAGMPLAGMTALQGLRDECLLPLSAGTGQRVLIVGASGGVGHLAVQIAKATGAHTVGVCSARNVDLVRSLGADAVIDYTKPDPYRGQPPFDVVLDCVASDYGVWLPLLKSGGRYASCVPGPGVLARSLANFISGKRVRPVLLKSNAADLQVLDGLWTAGKLKVIVDSRYPLERLAEAWERSKGGRAAGKIVVEIG